MDELWKTLIQVAPWGFVIIALRYLDIKEKADERRERDANAKEMAQQNRETQIIVGKGFADAINNIASVVGDVKMTVIDQYKNIGITQDVIDKLFAMRDEKRK